MLISQELAGRPGFRDAFARWAEAPRRGRGFAPPGFDADPQAQRPWVAISYGDGSLLEEAVADGRPLSLPAAIALAAGLAKELAAAHEGGSPHGDLKPSGVLLTHDGPLLLPAGAPPMVGAPGAWDFTSPEQALGCKPGPASDMFSLGAVLAFAASGKKPYGTGSSLTEIRGRLLDDAPELGSVPAELRPLIERCMAREPTDRPTAVTLNLGSSSSGGQTTASATATSPAATTARAQPARTGTPPAAAVSVSRLDWKGLVTYKITSEPRDWDWPGTSHPWQDDWVLSADCASGPCGATLSGDITADPFAMTLSRDGATYTGSVPVNDLWTCAVNGKTISNDTKLSVKITATKAAEMPAGWVVTAFSGTVTWEINPGSQGGCGGGTYTIQLHSAQRY